MVVDSEVSRNFLATKLAKDLGLEVKRIPAFTIEIGNGQKEKG